MDKVAEQTEARDTELTPQAAREYVEALDARELAALASAVGQRLERERIGDGGIGPDGAGEANPLAGWNYQREPWSHGHIQRDPKPRKMKDGSVKVYGYWYFHWIEGGSRKSTYIGNDDALASWKAKNPK